MPPEQPALGLTMSLPDQPALDLTTPPKRRPGRPKGGMKFGGRKAGTPNKHEKVTLARSLVQQAIAGELLTREQIETLSPLDVLRLCMARFFERGEYSAAVQCAAISAPYCHARLAQTDLRVTHHDGDKSNEQIRAEIEAMRRAHEASRTIDGSANERVSDQHFERAD